MNDFQELLKEAFLGEEPYTHSQGQTELRSSIRKFEGQDRMLRVLLWSGITLLSGLTIWAGWSFLNAPDDAPPKQLILYATLFLFLVQATGSAKMFIFSNQKDLSILKELKRVQLLLLERS